jgi:hypothetical protein
MESLFDTMEGMETISAEESRIRWIAGRVKYADKAAFLNMRSRMKDGITAPLSSKEEAMIEAGIIDRDPA